MAYSYNNPMYHRKQGPGWGVIIVALIFLWPLGLYILIKKLDADRAAVLQNSKTLKIVGIGLLVFAGIGILGMLGDLAMADNPGDTLFSILFAIAFYGSGGYFILRKSWQMKAKGERFKQYINMVVNNGITSMEQIASSSGNSFETVREDLQEMIDREYFRSAYIDDAEKKIILSSGREPSGQSKNVVINQSIHVGQSPGQQEAAQPVERVTACQSCGANNKITGTHGECQYCGGHIG